MLRKIRPLKIGITWIMLFLTVILAFLLIWGLVGYWGFGFFSGFISKVVMILGFIPAILAAGLIYNLLLPIWTVWVIKKSENKNLLVFFLLSQKVIYREGRKLKFKRGYIRPYQHDELELLSDSKFCDDERVKNETQIGKSFADFWGTFIFTSGLSLLMLFSNNQHGGKIVAIAVFIFGIVWSVLIYRKTVSSEYKIKLSEKGIYLSEENLIGWDKIKNENIRREWRNWYFEFEYQDNFNKRVMFSVKINDLDTKESKLNYLIYIYKGRFGMNCI
jgi:hypothetical protein